MSKKYFLSAVMGVAIVFLLVQYLLLQHRCFETKTELKAVLQQHKEVISKLGDLQAINTADNYFLMGEYEQAFEIYKSLPREDSSILSLITNREKLLAIQNSISDSMGTLALKLNESNRNNSLYLLELNLLRSELDPAYLEVVQIDKDQNATPEISADSLLQLIEELRQIKPLMPDTIIFKGNDDKTIFYYGFTSEGVASGKGAGLWLDGGYYYGDWMSNKRHGNGFYLWPEGDSYIGGFKNDFRQGMGTYRWLNGEYYTGNWENNKRHGQGTLYDSYGKVKYSGEWKDDYLIN